jgi:ABC-type polysaccharide/polyol phosphate export permease
MSTQEEAIASLPLGSLNHEAADVAYPSTTQSQLAFRDIIDGLKHWPIWLMLAYQDIKLRYRRSVLGPLWLTLSMAITVYSMGFLYSHLFHIELAHYFPFLVAGMLGWSLISTVVIETIDGLISSDGFIKQIKLPYTLYIHRIVTRNVIIFFHNLLVIVPIYLIFHANVSINLKTLFVIPGLLIIYFNAISYGLILGMIGARYRDVSQIIKSLVQVVFFITPVMWSADVLKGVNRYIADANPFYSFLELIRAPLLGAFPTLLNLSMVTAFSLFGGFVAYKMLVKYRSRIVYWL